MKKKASRTRAATNRDTLRRHYDFSKGVRGATVARYARGANVVVIEPTVLDVFPDGVAVNEALRALAPVFDTNVGDAAPSRRMNAPVCPVTDPLGGGRQEPEGVDFDPATLHDWPNTKRAWSLWPTGGQHRPIPAQRVRRGGS